MSIQDRLAYLLQQAVSHTATAAELQELSDLIQADQTGHTAQLAEMLLRKDLSGEAVNYDETYWNQVASNILAADRSPEMLAPVHTPYQRAWLAAAIVSGLLLLSGAAYWLWQKPAPVPMATVTPAPANDVAPGTNKAVLTLADGTQVPLDSAIHGALAQQGNTKISRQGAGKLTYTYNAASHDALTMQYNTLRTPRGGQFEVTLPDGTHVWLNAESTLKYPVSFTGRNRQVELSGEAYFEVAANAQQPFRVMVPTHANNGKDSLEIAVLGTHFNVMAYNDEQQIKTTLLEGAVRVSSHGSSKRLEPGEGVNLNKNNNTLSAPANVNTEEAVAWKNGFIQLEGNDIASAMRLISRWYDVEVIYKAPVSAHFRGIIPRNVPVSQVLKMMELTGEVHFEIKGKQLIVSP
ncbi:transmembrane sensor [Chitinophaga sp. W3I9]|uniref:FecR family protein n=1 Tax=Chitinophaga sp. W3I9 TaxID=3373924 RepID=UPI003D25FFCF